MFFTNSLGQIKVDDDDDDVCIVEMASLWLPGDISSPIGSLPAGGGDARSERQLPEAPQALSLHWSRKIPLGPSFPESSASQNFLPVSSCCGRTGGGAREGERGSRRTKDRREEHKTGGKKKERWLDG